MITVVGRADLSVRTPKLLEHEPRGALERPAPLGTALVLRVGYGVARFPIE
ncbi:hypothetical protein [Streptomyces celluloflavus]|uniref:Uncharacterized protein n=1 Tax=Streptomyces celluloflavus TaxID=58344 RepID=A0ABW7RRD0_9ACTN|nr:hypothetical protein OG717_02175 [Streptomyces celluloflavus]